MRIRPGSLGEIGLIAWAVARISGRVTGTTPPNLFLVLGKHRKLFRGWLRFAGRLMPGGVLPRRETELVILRIAHLRNSRYEFDHHVRLGKRAGITPEAVERVVAGPDADGWSEREQALLTTADALHFDQDLDDAVWETLRAQFSEREAIELCMLVGHYEMLATTISALRIPPDTPRGR